jgi:serine/threonine-protein kinase
LAHHVGGFDEIDVFINSLQRNLYFAAFGGLMYLAFEPYMRRSAPERVVSWNRLLAGDWRDPLVGRDLLIGAAAASFMAVTILLLFIVPLQLGYPPRSPGMGIPHLFGIGELPGRFSEDLSRALITTFVLSFLILLVGLLLRRKWLGTLVVLIVATVLLVTGDSDGDQTLWVVLSKVSLAFFFVLLPARFGVLALISGMMFGMALDWGIPLGTWFMGFYFAYTLILLAIAVFGFYTSTGGTKVFEGKTFLPD